MNREAAASWAVEQKMLPEVPTFPNVQVVQKDPQPVPTDLRQRG
jgi:hypothetical protein